MNHDPIRAMFDRRRNATVGEIDRAAIDDGQPIRGGDVFIIDQATGESRRAQPHEIPIDIRRAADAIRAQEHDQ